MVTSADDPTRPKNVEFISPYEKCISCGQNSGPKYSLAELRGPSDALRKNIVPSSVERLSKKIEIERAESEIDQLDKEIVGLSRVIASLRRRKSALQNVTTQEKSLLAPIRKLSPDILRHLFLVC
ncbi:hypothetical protein BDQ17DRAFT_1355519 [Cyathus striatus]|nr:hypothetical protein BDQ17DRAFT_1355519 [Cyathus striatus]